MPPLELPPLIPQGSGFPEQPADQSINDLSVSNTINNYKDLKDSLANTFPVVTVNGQSISDLVNQAQTLQAENQYLLDNYPDIANGSSKTGFDISQAANNLFADLNSKQSFASKNTPVNLGEGEDFERYVNSEDYKAFGYTPGIGREQEFKYGRSMSWGDTMGRAIGGGSELAWDTFVEGWKGWGRMANALFTLDASKLMGSEEERYQMAKEQEEIFNKYAIFNTETSEDGFFNRQFFGTMLQQSGFAIGAAAQWALENYLTMGLSNVVKGATSGIALARAINVSEKTSEIINGVRKASGVVLNSEKTVNSFANAAKSLIPAYGTIDELAKLHKAGAGLVQLGMVGLGATKRALSEFNMARSESIFESASTYKQLKDRLIDEYKEQHNGQGPTGSDLEKIKQSAEDASHDNFWTNVGVLSVMNRIQFDNMFKSFSGTRNMFNETATHLGNTAFKVSGDVAGKPLTKVYQKGWFFGELGAVKDIAKDFGKKQAAWEATKMLGKGLMKIEGSEGVQELIQTASDKGLEDYYYDLYHGKKGYTGKMDAVLSSIQNPLTDMEGAKTFLMGALTGALISPGSKAISKINETIAERQAKKKNPNYQSRKEQAAENIALVNSLYSDPTQFKKEWIAAIKVNNKAADTMEEAAKNHNRYVFYNAKDSAFAKTISAAIKLNMFDSVRDSIKELGASMSDEDFKQAFDLDATSKNRGDVRSFMNQIANNVDDYYKTFTTLKDKFGDKVLPELYRNNKPEEYFNAKVSEAALNDAIEILATNTYRAKQSIKRASALQTEIGSNPNIGGSSIEVLTKMGSEKSVEDHIKLLEDEIKLSTVEGVTLTPEQKEILKNKKKELDLAKRWQLSYNEIINNSDESYSPTAEKRAYEAYADLINLFNARVKNTTTVSKSDVDASFISIIDYIRLNKDNKSYVDAINLLSDPYNMKLITDSMINAHRMVNETFKGEHKQEVKEATDTEDDLHDDDFEERARREAEKTKTEKTELEIFLQKRYNDSIAEAKAKGMTNIPSYENWKKTAGPGVIKEFEESKKGKTGTTTDEDAIIVNGKPSHILSTIVDGDNVIVEYEDDATKEKGKFIINKKTRKVTDEAGNAVDLKKPTAPETDKYVVGDKVIYKGEPHTILDISTAADGRIMYHLADKNGKPILDNSGVRIYVEGRDLSKSTETSGIEAKKAELAKIETRLRELTEASQSIVENFSNTTLTNEQKVDQLIEDINYIIDEYGIDDASVNEFMKTQGTTLVKAVWQSNKPNFLELLSLLKKGQQLENEIEKLEGGRQPLKGIDEEYLTANKKIIIDGKPVESYTLNDNVNGTIGGLDVVFQGRDNTGGVISQEEYKSLRKTYIVGKDGLLYEVGKDTPSTISKAEDVRQIEPELEKGDYRRAYALGRASAQGKNINHIDNFDLMFNYPFFIEAATKIETDRLAELDAAPKAKANSINEKYDQQAKDLVAKGKPVPEDVDEDEEDVPDVSQGLNRKKLADMKVDSDFGNAEYQVGWRQLYPSNSLANKTDNSYIKQTAGTVEYTRTDVNKNYVFDVATPEVIPGKALTYKVMTDDEYYDSLPVNTLTGKKYNKAELFNSDGTVKKSKFDEVPIGVYAEIRGKETLIGTIHDPLWIEYEINGKRPHIATPEGISEEQHIKNELKENRAFRKVILDAFNTNSNFVITGHISSKAIGILKLTEVEGLLKDRVNPKIGEGGQENRHGFFAIVRNGRLETDINNEATNVQEASSFNKEINNLSGVPALMIPTPIGTYMPTYIGLPKVDKGQAEFIIEAWKAFTGKTENPGLVSAVYNTLNRTQSEGTPDIGVLRDYISQYITNLENPKKLDRVGNGSEAPKGSARLNIYNDGNIGIEVKDEKTDEWFNNGGKPIRTVEDLPANIIDLLQNLRTTIKFENRRNSDLVGINSTKKIKFLSMKDGKLISKEMTYNEYIMERATTNLEKGTQSENTNKDWVYFANPVVKMEYSQAPEEDLNFENEEKESVVPADTFESVPDEEDLFAQLERAIAANNMTEEQVKEEANKCNTNPFEDA